jgi:energy-coupling factor transporter ATP-binding protein EcfA2
MAKPKFDWKTIIENKFFKQPGEHMTVIGTTGTGKTQYLYFLLDGILKHGKGETIVWLDVGKSAEILTLARFKPLNVILIDGTDIAVSVYPEKKQYLNPIDKVYVRSYSEIWKKVKPEYINVICLQPFLITDIAEYTRMIGKIFKRLIKMASRNELPVPMTIFGDEFHLICPERNNQLSKNHYAAGAIVQMNVELLRSAGIRIIMGSQGVTKLRYGVRSAAQWRAIKRGCRFVDEDDGILENFNRVWSKLKPDEGVIADPFKHFSGILKLPFYGDGKAYGTVRYIGMLGKPDDPDDIYEKEKESEGETA